MIFKVFKRDLPFVQVDKTAVNDARISFRAKGVLIYLLSKPENWIVRSEDILQHGTEGRDAIRNAMKELQEFGYAHLVNTQEGREWHVFETPEENPHRLKTRLCAKPEKANMAKSATTNKEKLENNNESTLSLQNTKSRKKFTPPTLEEVKAKCQAVGLPVAEAEAFINHHEARGWRLGRQTMVSWPSAWGTWVGNYRRFSANGNGHAHNGNGHSVNGVDPAGWKEWLKDKPVYLAKLEGSAAGTSFRFAMDFMKTEFRRETKTVKA